MYIPDQASPLQRHLPYRPPHSGCDAKPTAPGDAFNLLDTSNTATDEGMELHYACKPNYALEQSNPDLASDGNSFKLGWCMLLMLNKGLWSNPREVPVASCFCLMKI